MTEDAQQARRQVIVVGAGPVGLTAAIACKAHGLDVVILEAESQDRVRPGSRAIYLHGATLRVLERIRPGLGHATARAGLVWPTRRTLFAGREVFKRTYSSEPRDKSGLPHFTSLPQVDAERLLHQTCAELGIQVIWASPVLSVETTGEGVRIHGPEDQVWLADYVIGADGGRSTVRAQIGVEMEGSRSVNSFVIADVSEDPDDPLPLERIFHYQDPSVGGRNVLLVPFAGGWRADLQCLEDDDPEEFSQGEGLKRWIAAVLGPRYAQRITWVSTYQFLQVVARSLTDAHHRVLLVGEAAHLFAPFGARGMNSGVADAEAAARAIAAAVNMKDPATAARAIDEFSDERRSAALYNRDAASIALNYLQGKQWRTRLRKHAAAFAARWWEPAGKWLDTAPYGPTSAPPTSAGRY